MKIKYNRKHNLLGFEERERDIYIYTKYKYRGIDMTTTGFKGIYMLWLFLVIKEFAQ